jgi:hypothetical protein
VFDSESSQMCVCNQIGHGLTVREHLLKNSPMPFGGANNPCTRLVQPTLYTGTGLFERKRTLEDPRVRTYSNKCAQNRPA